MWRVLEPGLMTGALMGFIITAIVVLVVVIIWRWW